MINVIFYRFSKKANSTARPDSSTASYTFSCLIRKESSIINPYLEIAATKPDVHRYNYCYIPLYSRYYFINDIEYSDNVWLVKCSVDVLATYQPNILSSTQYVLRSASEHDDSILDNFYPTKGGSVSSYSAFNGTITRPDDQYAHPTTGYFTNKYSQGYFVLGIISTSDGSANPKNTGISYYELAYDRFRTFITNLLEYVPDDFGDVADGYKKSFFNPMQYIVSCRWYPITMKVGVAEQVQSIPIAGYNINVGSGTLLNSVRKVHLRTSASIPKHPDYSGYAYRQMSPYSDYKLIFEPFGTMALDTTKLYNASTITLDWYIDNATGQAELFVSTNVASNIANAIADVGVDVPIAQISVDYIGATTSALGAAANLIDFFDSVRGLSSVISGIGNTVNAMKPTVSMKGTTGSYLAYCVGYPTLYLYSMTQVDVDNTRYGRPLCKVRRLDTQSGYVLLSKPVMSITGALKQEMNELDALMSSGFYIEG